MAIKGIFWDFGGVIADSPFDNLNRYEQENGLPQDFLRLTNAINPDTNAWACFERGEISIDEFDQRFLEETTSRGHAVPGHHLLPLLEVSVRPQIAALVAHLKGTYAQACLTNNLPVGDGAAMSQSGDHHASAAAVLAQFDFVQESSQAGTRKPEVAFFEQACVRAGLEPAEIVFLDDLGINLKPARQMGMTTIKVSSANQAIESLAEALGMPSLLEFRR